MLNKLFYLFIFLLYYYLLHAKGRRSSEKTNSHSTTTWSKWLFPHPLFLFLTSYFTYRDSLMNDMACGVYLNAVKVWLLACIWIYANWLKLARLCVKLNTTIWEMGGGASGTVFCLFQYQCWCGDSIWWQLSVMRILLLLIGGHKSECMILQQGANQPMQCIQCIL